MKFFSLIFLMLLIGCEPKESKPELDYVKMEISPSSLPPSTINLDLKNKLLVFNNHTYMNFINENGEADFDIIKRDVEFSYIELNDDETSKIKCSINQIFLDSIIKNNKESIANPDKYFGIINDGISVKIDIVHNKKVFSSDSYLILNHSELLKINEVFKIIKDHAKSNENKKYLESLFH